MIICVSFLGTGQVSAQAIDLDKINKIPRYSKMSQADFESKSKIYTEVPQGDMYLEYSIRLRDGFQKLGLNDEERSILETNVTPKTPADKFDISNLRDVGLAEEKNHYATDDSEDSFRGVDTETGGAMVSRAALKSLDSNNASTDGSINLLGPVARYTGPANILASSRLEIFAMQLSHDITTKNWFLNYILSRNYTLMGMEQIADNRVDAEYVLIEKGISYVVRTAAISNGRRMVLISYYVPEKFWEQEREYQEMTINSFKFINPQTTLIDDKRTHGFLDLVKFDYPSAWRLIAPSVDSIESMSAKLLYSLDKVTLQGEININLISTELDTNLMKEVEYLREDLKKKGLGIGAALDTNMTFTFSDKITFSRVEAYEVAGDKKGYIDYELWLAIMVEDRYYYIATMLTPGREADFYTWARNTEAFSTVIQSLMPQVAGETLDAKFLNKVKGIDSGGAAVAPQ